MTIEQLKKQFKDYSWSDKILFVTTFYGRMVRKTTNKSFQERFEQKINEIKLYQENEINALILIAAYDRILDAREETKTKKIVEEQERIKKSMDRIKKIQTNEFDKDAEAYLASQLLGI